MLGTQALERQKDFFDSLRSERDDLRDEVVVLKEQLKVCKRNKKNLYLTADFYLLYVFAEKLNPPQYQGLYFPKLPVWEFSDSPSP